MSETTEALIERALGFETLRGLIRMGALVVMDEVGETDKALASAIAAKAALDVRAHVAAAIAEALAGHLAAHRNDLAAAIQSADQSSWESGHNFDYDEAADAVLALLTRRTR